MSSPSETVDQLFGWLAQVLGIALPRLPFAGLGRRLTALFQMFVPGPLPAPDDPLPWHIPIAGSWQRPLPGATVSIDNLAVQVTARAIHSSDFALPASQPLASKETVHGQ